MFDFMMAEALANDSKLRVQRNARDEELALVKNAIGSFGHAEMDASLQFNMPPYASAIVSTDEIVAKLSA